MKPIQPKLLLLIILSNLNFSCSLSFLFLLLSICFLKWGQSFRLHKITSLKLKD
ncbi:hypothetical protein FM106_28765 [Brachybacterium faecium]|nr:hypothetical protein FM106_28765 [Brachybacterium faecium]